MKVSRPVRVTSMTVVAPSRSTQRTAPLVPSPTVISNSTSIHLFCSGTRSVRPTITSPLNTWSWIFCTPFTRCREVVRMGSESVPGIFICMMCVKVVVALRLPGMNIE